MQIIFSKGMDKNSFYVNLFCLQEQGKIFLQKFKATFLIQKTQIARKLDRAGAKKGASGGPALPIGMLGPPINKLTLLKTVAFVLNFKLCHPSDNRLASVLT